MWDDWAPEIVALADALCTHEHKHPWSSPCHDKMREAQHIHTLLSNNGWVIQHVG